MNYFSKPGITDDRQMWEKIIDIVSKSTGVSLKEIKSKSRKHNIVKARHICLWKIFENTELNYSQTGYLFAKDGNIVKRAEQNIRNLCLTDKELIRVIQDIDDKINTAIITHLLRKI